MREQHLALLPIRLHSRSSDQHDSPSILRRAADPVGHAAGLRPPEAARTDTIFLARCCGQGKKKAGDNAPVPHETVRRRSRVVASSSSTDRPLAGDGLRPGGAVYW
jgi:hypothetical protein